MANFTFFPLTPRPMKMKLFLSFLLATGLMTIPLKAQKVFKVDSQFDADVKIYETDVKSDADLIVFKVSSKFDTGGNRGHWYFVDTRSEADKKVFFVSSQFDADVKVYFTDIRSEAEWKNAGKKNFFN